MEDEEHIEIDPQSTELINWVRSQGGMVSHRLGIGLFEDEGRGLVALEDIPDRELLVDIPLQLLICLQTAKSAPIGPILEEQPGLFRSGPYLPVLLFLMAEDANPNSPWRPYLNSLPREFDIPLYWSAEDLDLVRG